MALVVTHWSHWRSRLTFQPSRFVFPSLPGVISKTKWKILSQWDLEGDHCLAPPSHVPCWGQLIELLKVMAGELFCPTIGARARAAAVGLMIVWAVNTPPLCMCWARIVFSARAWTSSLMVLAPYTVLPGLSFTFSKSFAARKNYVNSLARLCWHTWRLRWV